MDIKKNERLNTQIDSESEINREFPVVGVGASAGGLEPFRILLDRLPIDTGLAFVMIQHLAAGQESMLTEILARSTKMPVLQVEDGMKVEPNHVYVIPPGSIMTLSNGFLKLNPKGKSLKPVDSFFSSLAQERKNQAIGIVLSGTGTDGTEGLKAIKAEGGITFAQDPESAQYTGMPQSAISAESVDRILTPEKIAAELTKIAKHPQLIRVEIEAQEPKPKKETGLKAIFLMLKSSFGVDFSNYKESFIQRRIKRRMIINHIEKIEDYVNYLRKHPNELQAFFDDMLIGVTSFFREPSTFSMLKEKVFPELLKQRSSEQPLRIWIAGCSTGEEAYTYAISLIEFLEEKSITDIPIQVFGTDLNGKNVDKARQGIYPNTIESNVSEDRLKKYFTHANGSYQIAKRVRDVCVFAKQDLTADPPFSNLDLVSCRNMLIYFGPQLQERIIPILHYALKPNGFLILGESESVGKLNSFFESVTKKGIIYKRKQVVSSSNFRFGVAVPSSQKKVLKELVKKDTIAELQAEIDQLLTTELSPPILLVNSNLDILVFRGNVAPFLSPDSGVASFNLAKLIRKEIRAEVQSAAYQAKKQNKTIKKKAIQFEYGAEQRTINIQVKPISRLEYSEPFFLVLFEDVSAAAAHLRQAIELSATPEGQEDVKDSQVRDLREELESSKLSLQTVIETQEATNEELHSAMEEVQSSNEELQSTNEELETAKEELQSSNEELQTLNEELKNRNQTLGLLNDDLANLQINIDATVVIVDTDLKIRRFTNSALQLLKILPSDVGRRITSIRLGIEFDDLDRILNDVITKLSLVRKEVTGNQNSWYEMKARPYLTVDKKIGGAVLSLIDITDIKKTNQALKQSEEQYRSLFANMIDGFAYCHMIFDETGKPVDFVYLQINDAFERITGLKRDSIIGKKVSEVIPGIKEDNPELFEIYGRVALTGQKEKNEHFQKYLGLWLNVSVYSPAKGYFATVLEDITERKQQKHEIESLAKFPSQNPNPIFRVDEKGTILYGNQSGASLITAWNSKVGESAPKRISQAVADALTTNRRVELEETYGDKTFLLLFAPVPMEGYVNIYATDITERKKSETEREIMVEFLRIANATNSTRDLIEGALDFFQKRSGCEAVGIRLKERDDYPYYETKGFPPQHVQLENKLCSSDKAGCVIRDAKGKPVLECMCGNVICGRFDPSKKFFTENGSFWTNSTTKFIASSTDLDRQGSTRNRCNSEGYESLALIALRVGDTRLGLLQLNDKRKDMFTLETIQMWERIADRLALALSRTIAEEALAESERKYRTIVETAAEGIVITDLDGTHLFVNDRLAQMMGYSAEELLRKSSFELMSEEEQKRQASEVRKGLGSGQVQYGEFEFCRKDGSVIWAAINASPMFDSNRKHIANIAMFSDITERKKMEQQISSSLEQSQRRGTEISALLAAAHAVLQNKGFQDSARAIFDSCKELLGATAGYVALLSANGKENEVLFLDAGGLPCTVDPSLPMPIRGLRAKAYNSAKVAVENDFPQSEWKKFMPNGHVQLKNVLFAPLMSNQKPVGVIGLANKPGGFTKRDAEMALAFADIASVALANSRMLEKLKENEKELTVHSERLEELVEERTQKLRDSERLATIGATAGMVGHDIRNPLQTVTGELYLARAELKNFPDGEAKESLRQSLDAIDEQTVYVNKIVQDLQDFARPLAPKLEEIDLEKTVQAVLSSITIPEGVHFNCSVDPNFPKLQLDPTFMRRILQNLCNNGIQAMSKGGNLSVSGTCEGDKAIISVQDTGQGIPEEIRGKLFTPLVTTKAKGQGFGLAVIKRLTEALGGTIAFESEVGRGTKFTLAFPLPRSSGKK